MRRLLLYVAILLILTACTKQPDITINVEEPVTDPVDKENNETEPVRYTGEIISGGYFGNEGRIFFFLTRKPENF